MYKFKWTTRGIKLTIRLAVLTSSVSRNAGGLFGSVRLLSKSLMDNECEVNVYSKIDQFSEEDIKEWGRVPVSLENSIGPDSFGYQPRLLRKLQGYKPDIVHLHGLWMYPSVANKRWSKNKTPYMISPRGMLDSWALTNSKYKKKLAGLFYENSHLSGAACIHALCDAERFSIREYGLKNPIAVIPNGVELPAKDDSNINPKWAKKIPKSDKVLLFLSRIHPKKGIEELLQAWFLAKKGGDCDNERWHLVVAGWGEDNYVNKIKKMIFKSGFGQSIHFVGPQFGDEKEASLRFADAFILPSFSEGLPIAVLEAWSYSLPVMMTPQCNLPEGFTVGAAIKVSPDVESLSHELRRFFKIETEELERIGLSGKTLVGKKFSWEVIAQKMLRVYRWMLGLEPKPDYIYLD